MLMSRSTKCPSSAREYVFPRQIDSLFAFLFGYFAFQRIGSRKREREKENRSPSNGRTPLLDESGSLGSQQTSDGQRMPKINVRRATKRNTRARERERDKEEKGERKLWNIFNNLLLRVPDCVLTGVAPSNSRLDALSNHG